MQRFGKAVVKYRVLILIISLLLMIPAAIGYVNTRINYDILTYLPDSFDTMKGQNILKDEFGTGAFCMFICDGMSDKDAAKVKARVEEIDHVERVIWYDTFADLSIPMKSVLPEGLYEAFNTDTSTMMFIIFDTGTSEDETLQAVEDIRQVSGEQCFLSGMSAIVKDTRDLCDQEVIIYVIVAVLLSVLVLSLTMDSFLIPFLFLASIGMAIVYNLGTNFVFGEISYLTKALAAVLQLGVTMDYSIFLWHSYREIQQSESDKNEAMAQAITATLKSVVGSSITTVAGFIALCFMTFTLGLDLGIVMAKGVLFGVISCVTILPSMILVLDHLLEKTRHRNLIREFPKITDFILNHYKIFAVILAVFVLPAFWCQNHTNVYYNLDSSLPDYLPSVQSNAKLSEEFNMGATHMILFDNSLSHKEITRMSEDLQKLEGVKSVLGISSLLGPMIPESMVPQQIRDIFKNDRWEMMIITNEYAVASDEVNEECEEILEVIHSYDENSLLVGEGPCTLDLIKTTDRDFKIVSAASILMVFLIIFFVFKSVSLPFILIFVIEFAIFINLGIPYFTGTVLPFVANIVIGTIQLGSTVDYAILITSRYETERCAGKTKKEAVWIAHRSGFRSVIVSACSFFAATFGVGLYSNVDIVSALCILMARGALISMAVVLLILPSMLMLFDKVIITTSLNFRKAHIEN